MHCNTFIQNRTSAIIDDTFIYVPNLTLRMSGNSDEFIMLISKVRVHYVSVWVTTFLKQDNDSTVRGDGGAGTTSPMPEHKGFKLQ